MILRSVRKKCNHPEHVEYEEIEEEEDNIDNDWEE
jgi:hypothetical protein